METSRRRTALAAVAFTLLAALAVLAAPTPASADNIGTDQGCSPGYWKNHTASWEEYTPDQTIGAVFPLPPQLSQFGSLTLLEGLRLRGGPGAEGGAQILLRASIAAFLNAAHESIGYPYRRYAEPGDLGPTIKAAMFTLDKGTMVELAAWLDDANNLGCPLN